jgi:hypothetical protein
MAAPEGWAQIVSFGMAEVKPQNSDVSPTRALCMRLIVANRSEQSWRVDARVQAIVFDDGRKATPKYALALSGEPPMVVVPAGTTRTVDLFFPLPRGIDGPRALPRFDAVWSVQTPKRVVTGRTPFARTTVNQRAYTDVSAPFWLDPLDPVVSQVTLVHLEGPYVHPAR